MVQREMRDPSIRSDDILQLFLAIPTGKVYFTIGDLQDRPGTTSRPSEWIALFCRAKLHLKFVWLTELAFRHDTGDRLPAAVERFELVPDFGHPRPGLAVTRSREEVRNVAVKRHVEDQLVVPTQSLNMAQKSQQSFTS